MANLTTQFAAEMIKKILSLLVIAVIFTFHFHAVHAAQPDQYSYAEEMLALVNQARAQAGVAPLRLSRELMDAAQIRAGEITEVFSHTRPNGKKFYSLIPNGYYRCGENIAAGYPSPTETFNQWMNSPGHRANILRVDYTEMGLGYVCNSNAVYSHYWAQIFRRPLTY